MLGLLEAEAGIGLGSAHMRTCFSFLPFDKIFGDFQGDFYDNFNGSARAHGS